MERQASSFDTSARQADHTSASVLSESTRPKKGLEKQRWTTVSMGHEGGFEKEGFIGKICHMYRVLAVGMKGKYLRCGESSIDILCSICV